MPLDLLSLLGSKNQKRFGSFICWNQKIQNSLDFWIWTSPDCGIGV
jgi:hypothetical protein